MNRKQHIESLKAILKYDTTYGISGKKTLQYAIDHLSREWVSRKTHRKLQQELKLSEAEQVRLMQDKNKLKDEIDELKADKDRLQTTLDKKFEEVESWRENSIKLESDWEKASDKVSELETQRVWLLISTSTLLITLIICLFTR